MHLFLVWLAFGLFAQAGPGSGRTGDERDVAGVVRAVEARYRSARTLKAAFLERYADARNDIRIESGIVYFSRPGRMRWEYETPEPKLFLVDGRSVWFYVPADRTVTRARVQQSADWHTPLALLTGKARLSRFCARMELADVRVSAAGHLALRCLPRTPQSGFREVVFEVDAAYRLARLWIREPGGIEIEFRFADWQQDLPLPEAMFHFHAPAGVAIVEEASLAGPMSGENAGRARK